MAFWVAILANLILLFAYSDVKAIHDDYYALPSINKRKPITIL